MTDQVEDNGRLTDGSNVLSQEHFVRVFTAYLNARGNQADSATDVATIAKSAKEMGIDMDALKLVERIRKMPAQRRSDFLENIACYLDWAGVPNQLRLDLQADPANPFEEDAR